MLSLFRDTRVEVAEFSNLYREQGTPKRLAGTGERERVPQVIVLNNTNNTLAFGYLRVEI